MCQINGASTIAPGQFIVGMAVAKQGSVATTMLCDAESTYSLGGSNTAERATIANWAADQTWALRALNVLSGGSVAWNWAVYVVKGQ